MLQKNLSIDYIFREPKEIKTSNPLIILLHGYGSNEQDLFSFEAELPDNQNILEHEANMVPVYQAEPDNAAWVDSNDLNRV